MMIDNTRFYENIAATAISDSSSSVTNTLTPTQCSQLAKQIYQKCISNLEPSVRHWSSASNSIRYQHLLVQDLGSLYIGQIASLVYLPWRLATVIESSESDSLLQNAITIARDAVSAWEESKLSNPLHQRRVRVTLLESPYVGVKAMYAVLLHTTGHTEEALKQTSELVSWLEKACSQLEESECEVLYGRAGALHAILFLRKELQDEAIGSELAVALAMCILKYGQKKSLTEIDQGLPLLYEWHESMYLGAAHGLVGILQILLSLTPVEWQYIDDTMEYARGDSEKKKISEHVKEAIVQLSKHCFPSGNLDSSIRHSRKNDRLVHWCHGAPGHVILLVKASEFYRDAKFLDLAKQIATNVIWNRGLLRKGVGLCHGISGNAYALLSVARHDVTFLPKVHYFAQFALENVRCLETVPDRPYSLYEGIGGLGSLLMDLSKNNILEARFPLYEL